MPVRRRNGFTIVETVVACAILAVLAAVIVPTSAAFLNQKRIRDTVAELDALAVAINAFHTTVQNWPGRLSDLTTNLVAGQRTACTAVSYSVPTRWANGGPFLDRVVPASGFPLPIGIANNTLERNPNSAAVGMLNIVIPNVRFEDAQAMNDITGGPGDTNQPDRSNTTGLVRWSAPSADERVTVTYGIPVTKAC